ncbi:unnamed protein product [Tenebrio molitor]|nr:unnamed protein product [Tenebrio molitor]
MSPTYPFFKVTVSTLDVLGTLLMAIFDIIDTLNRTLLNQSHIRTFYKNLSKIDKFLGLPPTRNYFMSGVYSYKLTVIAMHVVIFATFSYDVYSTSFFYSWHHYKYNVFTFVLKYKITWFVVHLYMAACTIRRRFDLLNRTFVAAVRTTNGGTLAVKCMKCHDLLCDLVASINKVYGFQIMIMDKIVALSVVESSYLCLLFVIEARTKFSVVALATNLIWSADFMICAALVCFSCGAAKKQAQLIVPICQNLHGGSPDKDEILTQFSRQVAMTRPEFRCLGSFPTDYGSFFKILTSIFNYIVIVLQFDS